MRKLIFISSTIPIWLYEMYKPMGKREEERTYIADGRPQGSGWVVVTLSSQRNLETEWLQTDNPMARKPTSASKLQRGVGIGDTRYLWMVEGRKQRSRELVESQDKEPVNLRSSSLIYLAKRLFIHFGKKWEGFHLDTEPEKFHARATEGGKDETQWGNYTELIMMMMTTGVCVCVCVCVCTKSCPTLCNPMDRSPPGSSIHGTLQARRMEWVAL